MTRRPDPRAPFDRHVPPGLPLAPLAFAAWSVSCAALVLLLAAYIALTPGFAASLAAGGPAPGYLLRQVVLGGLPIVFALNLLGFWLYARLAPWRPRLALGLDLALRGPLFLALHAAIFAAAARAFGSFGGDPAQAVEAVGPTIAGAFRFGNLSGVYLYATAPSAFALFAAAAARRLVLPLPGRPVLALLPAFALAFLAYCAALSFVASRL